MVIGTLARERPSIKPPEKSGGQPPFPPRGERDDKSQRPKRPHATWKDQFIESLKTLDPQRAMGLLVTRPARDVITRIGAAARARKMEKGYLREVGEQLDHRTLVRRQHEEQRRKWDDWTEEHQRTMRVTGTLAIAILAAGTLSVATAPTVLSV